MMTIKESERRPFFKKIFRLSIIHTRQMKLQWISRSGNKKFQISVLKALAEFYYMCSSHQLNLKKTTLKFEYVFEYLSMRFWREISKYF